MLPALNKKTSTLKGEAAYAVLAKAKELERKGRHIIHLQIGEPDFQSPTHVNEAGIAAIKAGRTKYTPTLGIPEFRQAIATHVSRARGVRVTPGMVAVAPSAKAAIYLAMAAILEPGDEVIYPNPGFPVYENVAEYLGCILKPVPLLEEKGFSFDLDAFGRALSAKTKLIVLNSPSNPTGGVIPERDLRAIKKLIADKNCWIITDEIYSRMIYDGKTCPSIYSLPGMGERTILVDGFSKTYAMTGWRLGYLVMPERFMGAIDNLLVNTFACTATFTQYAGLAALTKSQKPSERMFREFETRRNLIVKGLNAIEGISCIIPQGAFYAFPNVKSFGLSSQKIADHILEKGNVALLPGTAFGRYGEGYLRISYANSVANIKTALGRIALALRSLK